MEKTVRVGTVTAVDTNSWKARVYFPDEKIVSGWLSIVINAPYIPDKGMQATDDAEGGSGDAEFARHYHTLQITPWYPDLGQTVLCIYDSGFNGDGFIIGGL